MQTVGSVVITACSEVLQVFPQKVVDISNKIARNRRWAQILAVITICICYVTTTVPLFMEVSQNKSICQTIIDIETQ